MRLMGLKQNNEVKNSHKLKQDILPLLIAECLIMLVVTLGGLALGFSGVISFSYKIIVGAVLGGIVAIANHLFLTISVDRAINNFMTLRGNKEMDDEEAEKFAKENSAPIQNAIKTSFILRTASMLVTLIVAFLTGWFNPLATAIPLLLYRPALSAIEYLKGKK